MNRVLFLLILFGCPSIPSHGASVQENWSNLCLKCHGPYGDGKTKEGRRLRAKDYTDPKVQAAFSDSGLLRNLLLGVDNPDAADDGRMPSFKEKLSIGEAKELIILIRSFNKGPGK